MLPSLRSSQSSATSVPSTNTIARSSCVCRERSLAGSMMYARHVPPIAAESARSWQCSSAPSAPSRSPLHCWLLRNTRRSSGGATPDELDPSLPIIIVVPLLVMLLSLSGSTDVVSLLLVLDSVVTPLSGSMVVSLPLCDDAVADVEIEPDPLPLDDGNDVSPPVVPSVPDAPSVNGAQASTV